MKEQEKERETRLAAIFALDDDISVLSAALDALQTRGSPVSLRDKVGKILGEWEERRTTMLDEFDKRFPSL